MEGLLVDPSNHPTLRRMTTRTFTTAVAARASPAELGVATDALVHIHMRCAPAIGLAAAVGTVLVVCHMASRVDTLQGTDAICVGKVRITSSLHMRNYATKAIYTTMAQIPCFLGQFCPQAFRWMGR